MVDEKTTVPTARFAFAFGLLSRVPARSCGITANTSGVSVTEDEYGRYLNVSFGWWRFRTPVANVEVATRARGLPIRTRLARPNVSSERGAKFRTTGRAGVHMRFAVPVHVVHFDQYARTRTVLVSEATVTVADIDGLIATLREKPRHIPSGERSGADAGRSNGRGCKPSARPVKQQTDTWECTQCGAPLVVPPDKTVQATLITSAELNHGERALLVDGTEVHRCAVHDVRAR
jgi:hypothetical protein